MKQNYYIQTFFSVTKYMAIIVYILHVISTQIGFIHTEIFGTLRVPLGFFSSL